MRVEQFSFVCIGMILGITVMSLISMTIGPLSVETIRIEVDSMECEFK
tara:strand:- start:661 stop:804 length:144 start_codon:yes stop_codon:yes gene_type:complete